MNNLISSLLDNESVIKIIKKYLTNFSKISDDNELIKSTCNLSLTKSISLYEDLNRIQKEALKSINFYLTLLDINIRSEMETLEYRIDLMNPDKFYDLYKDSFVELLANNVKTIHKGKIMYRARKGSHEIPFKDSKTFDKIHLYPFFGNDIKNPPINLTRAERFNREKYSYLYLANNFETALGETRPESGEICSVGKFACNSLIKLADLCKIKKLQEIVLRSNTQNWKAYYFSQFISDVVKEMGYDGIWYRSVQTNGYCAVVFDPELFSFVHDSESMIKIKPLKIKYLDLCSTKETTSFIVKCSKKYKNLPAPVYDKRVLKYIESKDDPDFIHK